MRLYKSTYVYATSAKSIYSLGDEAMTTINQLTSGRLLGLRASERGTVQFLHLPESGRSVSFAETARLTDALGARLVEKGLRPGGRVALRLANGLESVVALLAVMAAGGVAVPLNPRFTADELSRLLELSRADFLIVPAGLGLSGTGIPQSAAATDLTPIGLDLKLLELAPQNDFVPDPNPAAEIGCDSAALILYTSGTTGLPKGVVLSHRNLIANAGFVIEAHALNADETALCILPLFHINGFVVTLMAPLLAGMGVVLPERFDAAHFWDWVGRYRVNWFSAVPTILSLLLSHPDPGPELRATLRFARSASAPLPVALLEAFEGRFGIPVIETYGISEAACQVTANPLPPRARKPGSAGKAVGNELVVLDAAGFRLPCGVSGEVAIRGANVFGGYLDNPEADREALQRGWFHTGDLGYLDSEGYLFLTGRKREFINRAGEKISPREVEEVIHRLPQVEMAGVAGVPHDLYGEEVAAFVTLRPGGVLDATAVRSFCREHLAGFKVPREVLFIDEFPKGPSGKIQRRLLTELYLEKHAPVANSPNS